VTGTFRKLGTVVRPLIPAGIVTTSWVGVALVGVAAMVSNITVLAEAVPLNPVPKIVTGAPTVPCGGLKLWIVGRGVASGAEIVSVPLTDPEGVVTVTSTLNVPEPVGAPGIPLGTITKSWTGLLAVEGAAAATPANDT